MWIERLEPGDWNKADCLGQAYQQAFVPSLTGISEAQTCTRKALPGSASRTLEIIFYHSCVYPCVSSWYLMNTCWFTEWIIKWHRKTQSYSYIWGQNMSDGDRKLFSIVVLLNAWLPSALEFSPWDPEESVGQSCPCKVHGLLQGRRRAIDLTCETCRCWEVWPGKQERVGSVGVRGKKGRPDLGMGWGQIQHKVQRKVQ